MRDDGHEVRQFEWTLPKEDAQREHPAFAAAGMGVAYGDSNGPPRGETSDFEPMVILTGGVALAFLAERIATVVRNWNRGGIVVDARATTLQIYKEPDLTPGSVVVIDQKGKERLDAPDPYNILEAVIKAAKKK